MSNITIMDKFETVLNSIREILRKEGITGMDSIKHCLAFTISRYLTKDKCKVLDIDTKYSFEELISLFGDEEKMLERFYNGDIDSVIGVLYDKFKFSTDYKLTSKTNLKNILNKLKDIDIEKLALHVDIVGLIYELHLKTGTSQAMRDLGQYFTNRMVIYYMVELCKPKVLKNGMIETILDPTMGTGGFLTIATKYLNEKNKKIDWKKNKKNIYGFDIDENVQKMAVLNMFLETGINFEETLVKNDSLHNDFLLQDKSYIDKVDIILANEPFGVKGIVYAECCERVKKLKINGTKAEPLFLQLMMESLNENGRCAVIVPDGVLFNDAKLHTGTRKHLIENFNLEKVISLNGDFFMNTGVKSSILYFVNNGKTDMVQFSELVIENNKLKENDIIDVKYDDIVKTGYSLFVNKYNVKEDTKIEGVKYMKLRDVCEFKFGTRVQKINEKIPKNYNGNIYPCYGGGDISFYMNKYNREGKNIIVARFGVSEKCVRIVNGFFWLNDSGLTLHSKTDLLVDDYLHYIIYNLQSSIYKLCSGACQKNINMKDFENIQIPIPSIETQNKIVEILDPIYEQIERNNKSVEAYEKIKNGIVWSNTVHYDKVKLSEIINIKQGEYTTKKDTTEGIYGVYGGGDATYHINKFNRENKTIISKDGVSLKCIRHIKEKFYLNHHAWTFDVINPIVNELYVNVFLYHMQDKIYALASGSAQKGINQANFLNLYIHVPPLDVQNDIVKQCEYYDNMIDILNKENEKLKNMDIINMILQNNNPQNELSKSEAPTEPTEESEDEDESDTTIVEYKEKNYIVEDNIMYSIKKDGSKNKPVGTWNDGKVKKLPKNEAIDV